MDFRLPTVAELVGVEGVPRGAAEMEIAKLFVVAVAPLASVTRTVTVCVVAADGVPRITPVELSIESPEGNVPEFTSKV
jgi:hypothetical protein